MLANETTPNRSSNKVNVYNYRQIYGLRQLEIPKPY